MASGEGPEDSLKQVLVGRYGVLYAKPIPAKQGPKIIDLRSDTVTKPTEKMRVAMFEAEVGDDVFGDDPTVRALEKKTSEMLNKEAALYVPSGTMANLLSVMTHCPGHGDEVLLGDRSHISIYEQGGVAQLGGVHPRTIRNLPDGTLDLDDLQRKILPEDQHFTVSRVICVENTHNEMGGRAIRPEFMEKVAEIAREKNLKIHVDGARIFNAATALGLPVAKLVERADTVSICLSKGLGAPIGSVVAGSSEFIKRARRLRKALGGGMRQVGVIAAPALIALEEMSKNLQKDHDNAQRLVRGLVAMKDLGIEIDVSSVETNIVRFDLVRDDLTTAELVEKLDSPEEGSERQVLVKMCSLTSQTIRAVTHHQVDAADINLTLEKLKRLLQK